MIFVATSVANKEWNEDVTRPSSGEIMVTGTKVGFGDSPVRVEV